MTAERKPDARAEAAAWAYAPDMPARAPSPRVTASEYQRFRRLAFVAGAEWRAAQQQEGLNERVTEALRGHALKVMTSFVAKCDCGDMLRSDSGDERWEWHRTHLAAAVVAAITEEDQS